MARNGRAGAALTIAALGSFFAGTVATLVVARMTGALDTNRLQQGLDNPTLTEAQDPEAILDKQVTHMAVTPQKG